MRIYRLMIPTILALVVLGGGATADVTIARNGHSGYKIVVPDKRTPTIDYAAAELQHFVKESTGAQLPVITESEAGDGPAILIGSSSRVQKMGLTADVKKLTADGVFIKTVGDDVVLLGNNDRGQLYSVYVLLERYLGVRFLAIDSTVVPKQRNVILPTIDYSYSPPFAYREALSYDGFPKEIAARQRFNGPASQCDDSVGGKIVFYPFVHSSNKLVPPEKYYRDHPEYYGLVDGKRITGQIHAQLCFTNPDVLGIATEQVFQWINEHPDATSIDVSQNDGEGACQCEKCMAVVKEEGSQHGPIMRFVNAIADAVAKKYPGKYIDTLAYDYSRKPSEITKPRDNVIIRLCHAGCYLHGFEQDGLGAGLVDSIAGWTKVSKHVYIWHYATNFSHYIGPNPNLNGLAKDLKYYGAHGINGAMMQSNYQGSGGELQDLRQYLCSQLLWDPSRDPMSIRREFCEGYYGAAGKDVMDFLASMDNISDDSKAHVFATWNPPDVVNSDFVAQGLATLNRARDRVKDGKLKNHIDKLLLPLWYVQLSWPDSYGLSKREAPALLERFEGVVKVNKIGFMREGDGPNMPCWIAEMKARYVPLPKNVAYSFLKEFDKGRSENCGDWRIAGLMRNGTYLRAILMCPRPEGLAKATYDVSLPSVQGTAKPFLKFGTALTAASANGVRFSVLVNGSEVWGAVQQAEKNNPAKSFKARSIDLSKWAGQSIEVTLQIDSLGDTTLDWANWVGPEIIVR